MAQRDPLLPRPALVFIAVVASLGWLASVAIAVIDPQNSSPLLITSGVLTTVIGAAFGIHLSPKQNDHSGDDKP